MSREILFRGKRIDNGIFVYGSAVLSGSHAHISVFERIDKGNNALHTNYPVRPETLGEYTGLKDRNGNRIFEGDILSGHLDDLFPENETRLTVVWHETGWFGWNHGCHAFDDFENQFSRQFEIIGNIHDNPELLKGASES